MDEHTGINGLIKVMQFRVLRHGWECDPWGWVAVREDGPKTIILTDHGSTWEACPDDLRALMLDYQKAITETRAALNMVEGPILEEGKLIPSREEHPMTIRELTQALREFDPGQMVVVQGYEGGFDEVTLVRGLRLALNAHEEFWYGRHEITASNGVPAALLASSDSTEWRYRAARGMSDQNW